jgi:hypothetical protein
MYNLNYTTTTLWVQSLRVTTSGGNQTKYHWSRRCDHRETTNKQQQQTWHCILEALSLHLPYKIESASMKLISPSFSCHFLSSRIKMHKLNHMNVVRWPVYMTNKHSPCNVHTHASCRSHWTLLFCSLYKLQSPSVSVPLAYTGTSTPLQTINFSQAQISSCGLFRRVEGIRNEDVVI